MLVNKKKITKWEKLNCFAIPTLGTFIAFVVVMSSCRGDQTQPESSGSGAGQEILVEQSTVQQDTTDLVPMISEREAERLAEKYDEGTITEEEEQKLDAYSAALLKRNDKLTEKFQQSNENFGETCLDVWDGSFKPLVKYAKSHMNDAGSFQHIETKFRTEGNSIRLIMTYRGKNALGGIVTQTIVATANDKCELLEIVP